MAFGVHLILAQKLLGILSWRQLSHKFKQCLGYVKGDFGTALDDSNYLDYF